MLQRTNHVLRNISSSIRQHLAIFFTTLFILLTLQGFTQAVVNYDPILVRTLAGDDATGFVDGAGLTSRFSEPQNMVFDKISGNIYICDRTNNRIRKMTTDGVVTTYAGSGIVGHVDGPAAAARFSSPYGIAVDKLGNLYVSDAGTMIRKISTTGVVTTLAGTTASGYVNGAGTVARFNGLLGIAIDTFGTIFAVDRYNFRIRKITPAGVVSTFAGSGVEDSYDGTGAGAGFGSPHDIAIDFTGNLYVLEFYAGMRKITPAAVVTSVLVSSLETGPGGGEDRFGFLIGITSDTKDNLYVTVIGDDNTMFVRKMTPLKVASRLAGGLTLDNGTNLVFSEGIGLAAHFVSPNGIALDNNNNIYMADGNRICKLTTSALTTFTTLTGVASASQFFRISGNNLIGNITITPPVGYEVSLSSGGGYANSLSLPPLSGERPSVIIYLRLKSTATAGAHNGNISLASTGATTKLLPVSGNVFGPIVRFDAIAVSTLAGSTKGFADGAGGAAMFSGPRGVSLSGTSIIVADQGNNRIRKITSAGLASTIAGSGAAGFVNGTGTAAQFNQPVGVATDASGNIFVVDNLNNVIRKITTAAAVSTFAGSTKSFANGVGIFAKFNNAQGVGIDASGNLYIADATNNMVRKITTGASVTTLAGNKTAGSANDTGTRASFARPFGAAVDASGNIYIADIDNSRIRKITPLGAVSTLAGGIKGYLDGTGTAAQFNQPNGVSVDASGNVYVADAGNNRIRKISPAGVVTTVAGSTAGFKDSTAALAKFNQPKGLVVDASGNIYVADANNNRVRKIAVPVLKPFTTREGTASAVQSFSVSALYLTGNATVTAPAGYEVSLTSASGYAASVALAPLAREVASRIIYIRLKAANIAGTYNGNIALTATGASTKNLAVTGTVTAAPLAFGNGFDMNKKITVFPNPTKGSFAVQLNDLDLTDAKIRVTDANGTVYLNKKITGLSKTQTTPVALEHASSGIYFIQVISKDGVFTSKIIIE